MDCYICSFAARFECECSEPKVLICESHLIDHISDDNVHKFITLKSKASKEKFNLALNSLCLIKSQTILSFTTQIIAIKKGARTVMKQIDNTILAVEQRFVENSIT